MGRIFGLGIFLLLPCSFTWADPCPTLLTASFGFSGPLIAKVGTSGIVLLHDSYVAKPPKRIPRFQQVLHEADLGTMEGWVSVSSLPSGAPDLPYFAGVSASGEAMLFLPDGRSFGVTLPYNDAPLAIALYRQPLRGIERKNIPAKTIDDSAIRFSRKEARTAKESLELAELDQPISVLILTQKYLYRSTLRRASTSGLDETTQALLPLGAVRIEMDDEDRFHSPTLQPVPLLDFSGRRSDHFYLIATAEPSIAYEFTPPTKAVMFNTTDVRGTPSFLSVLSDTLSVVGTSTGTAYIVDTLKKNVYRSVGLPTPDGFRSLSARFVGGKIEIWAVTLNGAELYRWTSNDLSPLFSRVNGPEQPDQVATFATPLPILYNPLSTAQNGGYFTNIEMGPVGPEIEEVLVLAEDGDLYGLRQADRIQSSTEPAKKRWENHPFEDSSPQDEDDDL